MVGKEPQDLVRLAEGFTAGCGCDLFSAAKTALKDSQKASQLAVVVTLTIPIVFNNLSSQKASQLAVVVTLQSST